MLILRRGDADVEMVVVVPKNLHDAGRPRKARVRANVNQIGACGDEQVDERLGERPVDLLGALRRTLSPVATRVVDIGVEAVLVRGVLRPERPAAPAAEIADAEARRTRMSACISPDDPQHGANEIVRPHLRQALFGETWRTGSHV
jgi:hypothetical protein